MMQDKITKHISIGIVIYNECSIFRNTVKMLCGMGMSIYIYDNSPTTLKHNEFNNVENIKYFSSGKNIGLSIAMNTLAFNAYCDGFDSFLFLDQDTIITEDTLDYIYQKMQNNISSDYLAISFSSDNVCVNNYSDMVDVMCVRNSGTLFFIENLHKIGFFNNSYFVDGIDYEFCLSAICNKLKIAICANTPGFDHDSGQGADKYSFFGYKYTARKYSTARRIDIILSSIKLIVKSLFCGQFKFSIFILKSLFANTITQSFILLSKKRK